MISITVDDVINALGAFIAPFVDGTPIIRGQVNRVSPPVGSFIKLTEILTSDLETPTPGGGALTTPSRIDIQVDFYGPSSGDQCRAIKSIYRSTYAVAQFPVGIAPLYCSDATQAPLITGEQQYEKRWVLTATLQYNGAVTLPVQQAATTLAVKAIEEIQ